MSKSHTQCMGQVRVGGNLWRRCPNMCRMDSVSAKAGYPLCKTHIGNTPLPESKISVVGQQVRMREYTEAGTQ